MRLVKTLQFGLYASLIMKSISIKLSGTWKRCSASLPNMGLVDKVFSTIINLEHCREPDWAKRQHSHVVIAILDPSVGPVKSLNAFN